MSLANGVYRKATHTDLYLNASSCHHPSQKRSVLPTLVNQAVATAGADSLTQVLNHLRKVFLMNGFNARDKIGYP